MLRFTTLMTLALLCGAAVAGAPAKDDELLPRKLPLPVAEVQQKFQAFTPTPLGNKELRYQIVVPKDWIMEQPSVTKEIVDNDSGRLVLIGEFGLTTGRDAGLVATIVAYMRVPPQVTPAQFTDLVAPKLGFKILQRQQLDAGSGRLLDDALLQIVDPQAGPELARWSAIRRGEFIFVVRSVTLEKHYAKYKAAFTIAAASFCPGCD